MSELIKHPIRESIVERDFVYSALGARATVLVDDFLVASFPTDDFEEANTVRDQLEMAIRRRLADLGVETGLDRATQPGEGSGD